MDNLAIDHRVIQAVEEFSGEYPQADVIDFNRDFFHRDSLSENFINEIEGWARHALAANGFGDF